MAFVCVRTYLQQKTYSVSGSILTVHVSGSIDSTVNTLTVYVSGSILTVHVSGSIDSAVNTLTVYVGGSILTVLSAY